MRHPNPQAKYRGAAPNPARGLAPLTPFIKFFFHPKGERKILKRVQGASSLSGFGAEPQGFVCGFGEVYNMAVGGGG
jgi:hypothetical protein